MKEALLEHGILVNIPLGFGMLGWSLTRTPLQGLCITKLVTMLRLHYDIPIIPPSVIENQNFFFFSGMTDWEQNYFERCMAHITANKNYTETLLL